MLPNLINDLWVLLASLLVFTMTISVGFLEIGELNHKLDRSLYKTLIITGFSLFFMGLIGFNIAFAPTIGGVIGNPFYSNIFMGLFSTNLSGGLSGVFWLTGRNFFDTGLSTGTYFLFETAFASVTLALVGVVVLRKMKMSAFILFSIIYFIFIYTLPAAWIWNPTGWLYLMGVRDFAGGLVVHGAAGFAALAILVRIWQEEKKKGLKQSKIEHASLNSGWLTLAIILLWVGWFGFNPGSELAFTSETVMVVITTFLAAASAMVSTLGTKFLISKHDPGLIYGVNGVLMGLIVITPLAGYVSPGSAVILGLISGPIFVYAEKLLSRPKWYSDPVGVLPGHLVGGVFGLLMIAFFTQTAFATASGASNLPNGILFGGGIMALHQFGFEAFAVAVVGIFVFTASYLSVFAISKLLKGMLQENEYTDQIINNTTKP
ncbi:ammonium transporter [Cuniculiplasma divulgatum]|jgi:Amt family ammonium transporter|uniref:Amt family transporter n=1 Tax=Cuniculiplasma divulgatum TaxID=1673428 RepID=A0A1N5TTM0_9ARCH|nr:ammonium transporter [Cuniculiplasma divulgatum]SIM51812.1 Amt family transporter [Cuniculiplasma divulgatum]